MKKRTAYKGSANTRRMQKNVLLICLTYGYMGANFIISSLIERNSSDVLFRTDMIVGIIMLLMVPMSYFDRREGMCGRLNVVLGFIAHLGLCLWISYSYSSWWYMLLYAVEVVMSIIIVYIKYKRSIYDNESDKLDV